MADHNKPLSTSTYANFVSELDARFDDITLGLDPAVTSPTNLPTNAIRYSSAAAKWQKWNGTAWSDLAAAYAISITGNAGTVTNGVVTTGSYADPAWITSLSGTKISGNIAGNAGSATVLATARTINGVSFNGSANISLNLNNNLTFNNGGSGSASGVTFNGNTATTISYNTVGAPSTTGAGASGTWAISISGNAATASTASAVTNGVYTTGTQSIAGEKTFTDLLTAGAQLRVGSGTTSSSITMTDSDNGERVIHNNSDRIGFLTQAGGWGAYCDDAGNWTTTGNLAAASDERLKLNWRELPADFLTRLATVKMGIYDRKDTGDTQAGVSAQSMRELLPAVVREDVSGMLSVAYGNAALVAAVELAREVVALRRELNELKGV